MDDLQAANELFAEARPRKRKSIKEAREEFTETWRSNWPRLPVEIVTLVWGLCQRPFKRAASAKGLPMTLARLRWWLLVPVGVFLALTLPLVLAELSDGTAQRLRDAATAWAVVGGAAVAWAFQRRTSDVAEVSALFQESTRVRNAVTEAGSALMAAAAHREELGVLLDEILSG